MRRNQNQRREIRNNKRWTQEENDILARYVKANPSNMRACFFAVSDQLGRTPLAVCNHWYTSLSKDPSVLAFGLMTSKYFSRNRKNGVGIEISASVWRRFVNLIKSFTL